MTTPARVLVVDDDTILRTVLCELLADEGYEVRPANNGRNALALLDGWTPDVIVLDPMMPGMDGWAFRSAQLERRAVAHIPVIVLSATRDPRADAEDLRAQVVFPKPFELPRLLDSVRQIVGSGRVETPRAR
jgi:CheY-like chemotaxis protein